MPLTWHQLGLQWRGKKLSTIGDKGTCTIPTSSTNQFSIATMHQVQDKDQDKRQTNKGGGCPARKRKSWLPPGSCFGGSVARNVSFLGACMMTCYFVIAVSM